MLDQVPLLNSVLLLRGELLEHFPAAARRTPRRTSSFDTWDEYHAIFIPTPGSLDWRLA